MAPASRPAQYSDLADLASKYLVYLDQQGVLSPVVYGYDAGGLRRAMGMLPDSIGFSFRVYSSGWVLLWSVDDGYHPENAISSPYLLSGYNGTADPRIVILSLSR